MYVSGVLVLCVSVACVCAQDVTLYDAYFGKPLKENRRNFLGNSLNASILCTVPVRACSKREGRRVDGTCTNPHQPSRGATLTPFLRLLPAHFGPGNTLRPSKTGDPLPLTRHVRTTLLSDAHYFSNKMFSYLAINMLGVTVTDSIDVVYVSRYLLISGCCINNQIPNDADPLCIPIPVPADDPFLRRTNIRCMNLTRFETFQEHGCISNNLPAERYSRTPPLLDLSIIYGDTELRSAAIRSNVGGLLAFRMEGDREVPAGPDPPICVGNRPQNMEVACYNFGDPLAMNMVPTMAVVGLWFFREHNRLARQLSTINPCWTDDQLFATARQINIAQYQFIFFYELIPEFIGYKNALSSGLIFKTKGYVNDFDPNCEPGVYIEYTLGLRKFHDIVPGYSDLYRNGTYVGSRTAMDDILRSGILPLNNTEADLTSSLIHQPSDKMDCVIDSDLSNRALGEFHAASDISAIDIMRSRDAGLPPYTHYRELCGMARAHSFEDLHDSFDEDTIVYLSRLYEHVDDIDLMTGIYKERHIEGGFVGPVLYCIIARNLKVWRHSDKFFFEHGGFPAALTENQLKEVKSTRMARIMCDSAVGVEQVQPHVFLRISKENHFIPCTSIPGINLLAWKDPGCIGRDPSKWKK